MMRQEFDLGPLRDMTWLQLDGGFLYGAHEVADFPAVFFTFVTFIFVIYNETQLTNAKSFLYGPHDMASCSFSISPHEPSLQKCTPTPPKYD